MDMKYTSRDYATLGSLFREDLRIPNMDIQEFISQAIEFARASGF